MIKIIVTVEEKSGLIEYGMSFLTKSGTQKELKSSPRVIGELRNLIDRVVQEQEILKEVMKFSEEEEVDQAVDRVADSR